MKKLFFVLFAILITSQSFAQFTNIGAPHSTLRNQGGFRSDSTMQLPRKYASTFTALDSAGRIWFDSSTRNVWFHDGFKRQRLADTTYIDSVVAGGGIALGDLITGAPTQTNAPLYRNIAGDLNADALHLGYDDANKTSFWIGFGGDTILAMGYNSAETATFKHGKLGIGQGINTDTIDATALAKGQRQFLRNKTDSFAYLGDIQHQFTYKASLVSLTNTGTTTVTTTLPSNGRFIITNVRYVTKTITGGGVSAGPIVSLGQSSAGGYIDIVNATTLTGTPTANTPASFTIANTAMSITPSTAIVFNVSGAATIIGGGAYFIDVYVQGYYEIL